MPVVAVDPDGVVASTVGDDGVVGQGVAQVRHDRGEVDTNQFARRRLAPLKIVGAQFVSPRLTRDRRHHTKASEPFDDQWRGRTDVEVCPIDLAKLSRFGVHVHQAPFGGHRDLQSRVTAARNLSKPPTKQHDAVALSHPILELGITAKSKITDVGVGRVVEAILTSKLHGNRNT